MWKVLLDFLLNYQKGLRHNVKGSIFKWGPCLNYLENGKEIAESGVDISAIIKIVLLIFHSILCEQCSLWKLDSPEQQEKSETSN